MYEIEIDKHNHLVQIRHFGDFVKAELLIAFIDLITNWPDYSSDEPLSFFDKFFIDTTEVTNLTLHDTDSAYHHLSRERMGKVPFANGYKIAILTSEDAAELANKRFKLVKEKPAWKGLDIQIFQLQNDLNAFLGLPGDYGITAKE